MSNCRHSHLSDVWVIEQYEVHSLNEHLANGRPWDMDRTYGGLQILPPYEVHEKNKERKNKDDKSGSKDKDKKGDDDKGKKGDDAKAKKGDDDKGKEKEKKGKDDKDKSK
jgi:hypothetical protein